MPKVVLFLSLSRLCLGWVLGFFWEGPKFWGPLSVFRHRLLGRLGEGASFLLDYVILFAEDILIAEGGHCHPLLFLLNVPWAALCLGGGKGVPIRFQDQFFWSESRRLGNGTGVGGGGGLWGQWG